MKKIIITGATGMLGTAITNALQGHDLYGYSSKELDITCSFKLDQIVKSIKPDYIINCAAYTAVDLAETDQEKALKINALAVQKMAQVANQYQATLIHFSTDYVFNGTATQPYLPLQETDPINVYGASKLAGEKSIAQVNGRHYIFRISWLYAPHGKNFFKWVAGTDMNELKIVDSQTGSPTSALDVSSFIKHLVKNDPETYGVYHFTNQGAMTWFEFAIAINKKLNLDKIIHPVATFKTAAKRPTYSVMDGSDTIQVFNYQIPTVEEGLDEVVRIYNP
ncbi:dTDP-4-dehydrorhamnose reductase [Nonlabens xylanidelens]|uniref:dTDP-4-dehydrorhamnose reductase n=1 Tax=Nonlabens xylanidelens TaxID=191564 RepID=A0A2S6IRD1_9FLAO|nr:dTDP-4-dehydrorhamnose reductase [Nonlabens xylanidelens]PPK96700.1 dTDP-4-dehydrorhamnose reductase [Nonlabens xylanidelens]PQJ13413.1 dTDP-4-dehydrorhamnose reductase [Nonlabens xylanidelens]